MRLHVTTRARAHLEDVRRAEPLRLVVDVVAANALGERDLLHRLEGLPLLKKSGLHNGRVTHHTPSVKERSAAAQHLLDGHALDKHGVKGDVVAEVVHAHVVLERDLQLRRVGPGRLSLREGGE